MAEIVQKAKNGDCHQLVPHHGPRNNGLSLRRIGWLCPILAIQIGNLTLGLQGCRQPRTI